MKKKFTKYLAVIFFLCAVITVTVLWYTCKYNNESNQPEKMQLTASTDSELIQYGKELLVHTSKYLGPKGTVAQISNGMNCQNCHLEAGTRITANCLAAVASTYPKYRERSGKVETIAFRINECMLRSLNGKELDSNGKEVKAITAYLLWLGKDVKTVQLMKSSNSSSLPFLNRAADTMHGRIVFMANCQRCHGSNGTGQLQEDSVAYLFPPLWGSNSYNVSAGLFRLSRLATFIKYNMPYTPVPAAPQLTDEEAWDVAAFILSKERPQKFFSYDWPKLTTKPVDYPFGPFTDTFSAWQHKYGPFKPIVAAKQNSR